MRLGVAVTLLASSVALVWAESAAMAVWVGFDFSDGSQRDWPRRPPAHWPDAPVRVMYCREPGLSGGWYTGYGPEPADARQNETLFRLVEMRVGWPLHTFEYERTLELPDARGTIGWMMDDPKSMWLSGLPIPEWIPKRDESLTEAPCIRRIPVRPLWGGLAVAVTCHSIVLYVISCIPWWVVRCIRRARGLCASCGYDSRGVRGCPECGDGRRAPRGVGVRLMLDWQYLLTKAGPGPCRRARAHSARYRFLRPGFPTIR